MKQHTKDHIIAAIFLVSAYWMTFDNWIAELVAVSLAGWMLGKWIGVYTSRKTFAQIHAMTWLKTDERPLTFTFNIYLAMNAFLISCFLYSHNFVWAAMMAVSTYLEFRYRAYLAGYMSFLIDRMEKKAKAG